MLDHHRSRSNGVRAVAKLAHRGQGSLQIQQIVGAELLALQLNRASPTLTGMAEPARLLVWILPVTQGLAQGQRLKPGAGFKLDLGSHPTADRAVVSSGVLKRLEGQLAPQL